jgi:hypothetical protein
MDRLGSGQTLETVNLTPSGFAGSNPALSTNLSSKCYAMDEYASG